ncbi:unnamed protein product [Leptidea sinapis]|uniref:Uncharacterized protein n=2 Tax=Leptidea sinapis TaxID=189913 RepID=A0A5E4QKD3_9NEOP|nr:unnamed protein product [Leptidea sinapis]
MRSEILPAVRFAYYAGFAPYRGVRDLHNFYDSIKLFLNTQGLGWKRPESVPIWTNLTVEKIHVGAGKLYDPCTLLTIKRDKKSCIHFPKPSIDNNEEPSAIMLPLKSNALVSLTSEKSENALIKYYTTVSRCILKRSTNSCRHDDFVSFNNELWHWMKRDVAPYLAEEKLYTAYGGILRLAATVQSYGKSLSRRNLFSNEESVISKWHPWRALSETYSNIDTDSPRCFYIGAVLFAGVTICLLQIIYSLIFGNGSGCHCKDRPKSSSLYKDVNYANVESSIPAMLPAQTENVCSEQSATKVFNTSCKTGNPPYCTDNYDIRVSRDQMMDGVESENDDFTDESSTSKTRDVDDNVIDVGLVDRGRSPPKIDTSIEEVVIKRGPNYHRQMCSASTVTFHEERGTDTVWSGSESSSGESVSSGSSKSRCPRSSSRELAWAKQVITKRDRTRSSTATESH